jgi:hypothetical protein
MVPAPKAAGSSSGPRVDLPNELAGIFDEAEETREVATDVPPQARPEPVRPAYPRQPIPQAPPFRAAYTPPVASVNFPPVLDNLDDDQVTSADYRPDATVIAQVPDELLRAASTDTEPIRAPGPTSPSLPRPPLAAVSGRGGATGEEGHFREVFDQFLKTKKQCNEPVAGLAYDKFVEKLRKNAADLKSRFKCATVKFQVYVKNGKAALKATPVK